MSLATILSQRVTELASSAPAWRHFLKDFKASLLEGCMEIPISDYQKQIYAFRLMDFLRDNNIPIELLWIVVWLNGYENELNFVNKDTIKIPNLSEVNRIRGLFNGSALA